MIVEFPEKGTFKIEVTPTEIHIVDEAGKERVVVRTDTEDSATAQDCADAEAAD